MLFIGVLSGLCAALLQAISYILSRHILYGGKTTPLHLLIVSHIWMGMICWVALPFVWQDPVAGLPQMLGVLAFQMACYIGAQFAFFWTIRYAAASRISPLMGLKIIFSALLAYTVREETLNTLQITAVALTLVAAFAVTQSGEKIPWKAIAGTLVVVICFASSDLGITLMKDAVHGPGDAIPIMVPVFICIISYSFVSILGLIALPLLHYSNPTRSIQWPWRDSFIYAMTWLGAMICLFTTFATIGLVFGAIAQSLRGPFSVLMALAVIKMGFDHIEQQRPRADYIKQICSALLMVAAIALYCLA